MQSIAAGFDFLCRVDCRRLARMVGDCASLKARLAHSWKASASCPCCCPCSPERSPGLEIARIHYAEPSKNGEGVRLT